jgi:hypothetical protein
MSIENLLSCLHKVKKAGKDSWVACCPAHQDKSPSLTITNKPDGRILMYCFAGCDTYSILRSIDLDWQDILPESPIGHKVEKTNFGIYSSDALRLIHFETQIVLYIAYQMRKTKTIDNVAIERLETAMQRIKKANEVSNVQN